MNLTEQKYFISYIAYVIGAPADWFNDIVYTDEDITMELLVNIQESLKDKLNDGSELYYATQIINIVKI